MSFSLVNPLPDTSIKIKLNYPELNTDSIQESSKMITANFFGKANEPNVIYTEPSNTPEKFQARKLYICGKIHTIDKADYDGELIVEHISLSSDTNLFVCFLLKTDKTIKKATEIDDIIKHSGEQTESLDINKYFVGECDFKSIIYGSKDNKSPKRVIIYTCPIKIKESLDTYTSTTTLFEAFNSAYKIVETTVIIPEAEGFVGREGFSVDKGKVVADDTKNGDLLECELADVGADRIQTYQVPVLSDVKTQTTSAIVVTYMMFFIVFIATLWAVPYIHENLYVYMTNQDYSAIENYVWFNTAWWYNIAWFVSFWVPIILLFGYGFGHEDTNYPLIAGGMLVFLTFLVSTMAIYNNFKKKPVFSLWFNIKMMCIFVFMIGLIAITASAIRGWPKP